MYPTKMEANGHIYPINTDYRVALACFRAINDAEISNLERFYAVETLLLGTEVLEQDELILKEKIAGKKMKAELLWALIVKTWNHYVDGTTPKILRYIQTIEELPKLKLNNYGSK